MINLLSRRSIRVCLWALIVPAGTFLATAAVMSIPPDTRGIDIVSGQELFTVHCGSCHFARAGFPEHHAPNLHDIGMTGGSRKPNQSAAAYILESILDPPAFIAPVGRPGMPLNLAAELDPEEVRDIVGFLASCGAFPDYEEIRDLEIPDSRGPASGPTSIRREDMQLAENVLREKGSCLKCHSLYSVPEDNVFAPALFGAGLRDVAAIHQSMVEPGKEIKPKYRTVTILLQNGQLVSGQIVSRNDERLVLCARDEQNQFVLREISLTEIESDDNGLLIRESTTSLMPDGFDKTLTAEEIDAVIKLIRQLN